MKPVPDLGNEAEMMKRGRISSLYSARKEALEILRDAFTAMQSGPDFGKQLETNAQIAKDAADRLLILSAMWNEVA